MDFKKYLNILSESNFINIIPYETSLFLDEIKSRLVLYIPIVRPILEQISFKECKYRIIPFDYTNQDNDYRNV